MYRPPTGFLFLSKAIDRLTARRAPELAAAVEATEAERIELVHESGRRVAGRFAFDNPARLQQLNRQYDRLAAIRNTAAADLLQRVIDGTLLGWRMVRGRPPEVWPASEWCVSDSQAILERAAPPGFQGSDAPLVREMDIDQFDAPPSLAKLIGGCAQGELGAHPLPGGLAVAALERMDVCSPAIEGDPTPVPVVMRPSSDGSGKALPVIEGDANPTSPEIVALTASTIDPCPATAAKRAVDRGGRPEKFDWTAFAAEVVRLALDPDGLPEQRELMRHMMEWCHTQFGDETPGESTVRAKLKALTKKTPR
jgi:hypothetical protein